MKLAISIVLGVVLAGVLLAYVLSDVVSEPRNQRTVASIPDNYESFSAADKQGALWKEIQQSAYREMPDYRQFGFLQLLALSKQELRLKGEVISDFAPSGWKKYLHARGSIAKIKIVAKKNSYTGIFQGADSGLLRLSLTYKPSDNRAVAPGLALKVLRDGAPSANISALVSLYGQEQDYNFFKFPMSNIVPMGRDFGQILVHKIFSKASMYPEELLVEDMAAIDSHGEKISQVISPRQIFFVPNPSLKFSSDAHDVRQDFLQIPAGTVVYQIHAASDKNKNLDYGTYTQEMSSSFLLESQHVADIVTTSEFISSDFGDDGIFFRHQLRP